MANTLTKINGDFAGKDILSLDQFSPQDLDILFSLMSKMKELAVHNTPSDILKGTITTLLFLEPSSRTFSSFTAAIKRLGGGTIEIQNPDVTSMSKGESFADTIRVFESYSNAIVLRHKIVGAAQQAAEAAFFVPIINAGDASGEHPTQALLDLYTLREQFGRLDNLTGLFLGDPLYSRVIHSNLRGLSMYKNNTVYLLSPEELCLPKEDVVEFTKRGLTIIEIHDEKDIPQNCNFWYPTRVQKERFASLDAYEKVKNTFVVTKEMLQKYGNQKMIILDCLPRVGTTDPAVDKDPRAVYFRSQIRNGMYTRMALLALVLGRHE